MSVRAEDSVRHSEEIVKKNLKSSLSMCLLLFVVLVGVRFYDQFSTCPEDVFMISASKQTVHKLPVIALGKPRSLWLDLCCVWKNVSVDLFLVLIFFSEKVT